MSNKTVGEEIVIMKTKLDTIQATINKIDTRFDAFDLKLETQRKEADAKFARKNDFENLKEDVKKLKNDYVEIVYKVGMIFGLLAIASKQWGVW
jgi:archaellum component FlaC